MPAVKSFIDRFGTPEIEHPQHSVSDKNIARMRISVEYAQSVDLVPVRNYFNLLEITQADKTFWRAAVSTK